MMTTVDDRHNKTESICVLNLQSDFQDDNINHIWNEDFNATKISSFRSTCCVCFMTEEEQASTACSCMEFLCIYDERTVDNSVAKIFGYYLCCPLSWVFSQFGLLVSDNYTTVYAHAATPNGDMMFYHSPSGCIFCFDARKWMLYKHYLCCHGLCGTYGPNSGYEHTGATGLHAAANYGFIQTAKFQLFYGDDIDGESTKNFNLLKNVIRQTPLHMACINSHESMIKLLVLRGAKLNKLDSSGGSALYYACQNNLVRSIRMLVAYGANIFSDNDDHPIDQLPVKEPSFIKELIELQGLALVTPNMSFVDAIQIGHLGTVTKFIADGQTPKITNEFGETALALAVRFCKKTIALLLLSRAKKLDATEIEKYGLVLMRWSVEEGNFKLVQFLLKVGVNVNSKLAKSNTCLHLAVKCEKFDIVAMLVENGSNLDAENEANLKPLSMFPTHESKNRFFIQSLFPESLLYAHCYAFWFRLVQLYDVEGISERIYFYAKAYPLLVRAKNEHGNLAEEVATASNRDAIRNAYLWYGRYRLMDWRPEHTSATCLVFRAWDELSLDEIGSPQRVALKLMRRKDQWQRELDIRELITDSKSVVEIIRSHPASYDCLQSELPDEVDNRHMNSVADMMLESESTTNKEEAERMFFLVMPLADRNMFVSLKQDSWAGKTVDKWQHIFVQIARAVDDLHKRNVLHADLKSLNIVRKNEWILIDMDASCRIGIDVIGFKSSTAIMPPEAIYSNNENIICVKSQANNDLYNCGVVMSHPSFDVWSLGCLLYQMGNVDVKPIFQCSKDDNLSLDRRDDDSLWLLWEWSNELKERKLSKIGDPKLRSLLSAILCKDPLRRPSITRILSHPAISGKKTARMGGASASWDVFISYRVSADMENAARLYKLLISKGLRVWWDKACLEIGDHWEAQFMSGLVDSRIFVCLISKGAINNSQEPRQNFSLLHENSPCDNVLLEHRIALELLEFGYVDKIIPVLIGEPISPGVYGDYFRDGSCPQIQDLPNYSVTSVETKLVQHMERECLGTPLVPNRSVKSTFESIMAYQGCLVENDASIEEVANKVSKIYGSLTSNN